MTRIPKFAKASRSILLVNYVHMFRRSYRRGFVDGAFSKSLNRCARLRYGPGCRTVQRSSRIAAFFFISLPRLGGFGASLSPNCPLLMLASGSITMIISIIRCVLEVVLLIGVGCIIYLNGRMMRKFRFEDEFIFSLRPTFRSLGSGEFFLFIALVTVFAGLVFVLSSLPR